ncbi:hypothetical protein K2X30_03310 [bacterium]|nr:hypothetical protein [bacterium]
MKTVASFSLSSATVFFFPSGASALNTDIWLAEKASYTKEDFAFSYSQSPTYDWLKDQVIAQNIQDVDTMLSILPLEYRTNYTLVYGSRSLQGASYQYPRAILFGGDGKLILAFNGHPSQRNYDKVEIIQFDDGSDTFLFNEIKFSPGSRPEFRENPKSCTLCHRQELRPIWDTYAPWPGVYGSDDDQIDFIKAEQESFEKFKKAKPGMDRYRQLGELKATDPNSKLNEYLKYFPYWRPRSNDFPSKDYSVENGFFVRPNLRLATHLHELNVRRIATKIKRSDEIKKRILEFPYSTSLGPVKDIDCLPGSLGDQYTSDLGRSLGDYRRERRNRKNAFSPEYTSKYADRKDSFGIYDGSRVWAVALKAMGIELDQLSLGLKKNSAAFTSTLGPESDFALLSKAFGGSNLFKYPRWFCYGIENDLKKEASRLGFNPLNVFAKQEEPAGVPPVRLIQQKCMTCHEGGETGAPDLALDDLPKLAQQLEKAGRNKADFIESFIERIHSRSARPMPPVEHLHPSSLPELETYISELR